MDQMLHHKISRVPDCGRLLCTGLQRCVSVKFKVTWHKH